MQLVAVDEGMVSGREPSIASCGRFPTLQDGSRDQLPAELHDLADQSLTKPQTQHMEAYCLYLTGRYFWNKRTREGFEKAIDAWQRALAIDANYALAYAGIADAHSLLGYFGYLHPRDAYGRSGEAARRALEIDGTLAEAHTSMGDVALHCGWHFGECKHELATAVALGTGLFARPSPLFALLDRARRCWEVPAANRQALEIDPTDLPLIAHLGWHYYHAAIPTRP